MALQDILDAFKHLPSDDLWRDAPNHWVRQLSPVSRATLAKNVVVSIFGGDSIQAVNAGYKVISEERRIEVKLSTISVSGGRQSLMWQRINMLAPFTHLCFLAIYPSTSRMFLVPKSEIDLSSLSLLKGQSGVYQLFASDVDGLFGWMLRHEVFCGTWKGIDKNGDLVVG